MHLVIDGFVFEVTNKDGQPGYGATDLLSSHDYTLTRLDGQLILPALPPIVTEVIPLEPGPFDATRAGRFELTIDPAPVDDIFAEADVTGNIRLEQLQEYPDDEDRTARALDDPNEQWLPKWLQAVMALGLVAVAVVAVVTVIMRSK